MARAALLEGGRVAFLCPGCEDYHVVDGSWSFNGDLERPTIRPSVLCRAPGAPIPVCHSFVTDGRIEFLADSSHALAGQTVNLLDTDW